MYEKHTHYMEVASSLRLVMLALKHLYSSSCLLDYDPYKPTTFQSPINISKNKFDILDWPNLVMQVQEKKKEQIRKWEKVIMLFASYKWTIILLLLLLLVYLHYTWQPLVWLKVKESYKDMKNVQRKCRAKWLGRKQWLGNLNQANPDSSSKQVNSSLPLLLIFTLHSVSITCQCCHFKHIRLTIFGLVNFWKGYSTVSGTLFTVFTWDICVQQMLGLMHGWNLELTITFILENSCMQPKESLLLWTSQERMMIK